jgi:hypothetical protein
VLQSPPLSQPPEACPAPTADGTTCTPWRPKWRIYLSCGQAFRTSCMPHQSHHCTSGPVMTGRRPESQPLRIASGLPLWLDNPRNPIDSCHRHPNRHSHGTPGSEISTRRPREAMSPPGDISFLHHFIISRLYQSSHRVVWLANSPALSCGRHSPRPKSRRQLKGRRMGASAPATAQAEVRKA